MKPVKISQLIVIAGIFIRLLQYFYNRSFRLDELLLLRALKSWEYSAFFAPLGDHQFAPPGFLAMAKLNLSLFGDSESYLSQS